MTGERVRVYEVGPRDGLQNEAQPVATADKRRFIEALLAAGLREIEATSFVRADRIPQLADADELLPSLPRPDGVRYPVLVANRSGLDRAAAGGADAIAVFTAATDAFTERKWDEAEAGFNKVLGLWENDPPSRRYLEEIAEYRTTPPPPQWDGVYTATTK